MMDRPIVLDQPDQIRAFVLLQIYHKLKLEVNHPGGPRWSYSPAKQANAVMDEAGVLRKRSRIKATVFAQYEAYLREIGVLSV